MINVKFLLPLTVFTCTTLFSKGQISKGRFLLGGNFGISDSKTTGTEPESKTNSQSITIQLGKVIQNNTVVGIIGSFGNIKQNSSAKSHQYGAGVFYRRYQSIATNFYFFGEGDVTYNHVKTSSGDLSIGSDGYRYVSNSGNVSLLPGISYSLCKRTQIELSIPNLLSLSYSSSTTKTAGASNTPVIIRKNNSFSLGANMNSGSLSNIGIGFKFLLGK